MAHVTELVDANGPKSVEAVARFVSVPRYDAPNDPADRPPCNALHGTDHGLAGLLSEIRCAFLECERELAGVWSPRHLLRFDCAATMAMESPYGVLKLDLHSSEIEMAPLAQALVIMGVSDRLALTATRELPGGCHLDDQPKIIKPEVPDDHGLDGK
jgi:hypothetical protein